jgi:thymidylate synthase (FAD)
MEVGAQEEIRVYANAMYDLIKPKVPITIQAFEDFQVNSMVLTGPELVALKKYFDITPKSDNPDKLLTSPGENREFVEKLKILL